MKILLMSLMASCLAMAVPAENGSTLEKSKKIKWSFTPDTSLPNVLILGDSISIGYTLKVRSDLSGVANVYRPLKGREVENCLGTTNGVEQIDRWIGETKWDVIHFNFGLHDLKHFANGRNSTKESDPQQATLEQYQKNLTEIVGKLKATGAKLIFATTTPIVPECKGPLRKPEYPPAYNGVALKIMEQNGVQVNDLFAFTEPRLEELQLPKNCHFNAQGREVMGAQVAGVIKAALK